MPDGFFSQDLPLLDGLARDRTSRSQPSFRYWFRLRLREIRALVVLVAACLTLLGFQAWREYVALSEQINETQTSLANLASALSQHAEDTVEVADTAISGLVNRFESSGVFPRLGVDIDKSLAALAANSTRYTDITVLGMDGEFLATSLPRHGPNLSHREYFQHHRDDPGRGMFLGPPIKSSVTGDWVITVSRRVQSADGGFAGVIIATIHLSSFVNHYETYDLGRDSSIGLLMGKTLLARVPAAGSVAGQDVSRGMVFEALQSRASGSYRNTAVIDGVRRISGYRQSQRYPLLVVAAMSEDHALGAWRTDMQQHMAVAVLVDAIIALLGLYLIRQTWLVRAAKERLRESERGSRVQAEQYRLSEMRHRMLIDGVLDYAIYWLDREGTIQSWSAGATRLKGYSEAEIVGQSFSIFYTEADRAAGMPRRVLDEAAATGGHASEGWHVRKDGSRFWARVLMRPVHDADGGLLGFAKVTNDITDQQSRANELLEMERRERALIEATNADLERLSRHLTKARDKADRASWAKSRFLAGMSHELRTPLNGILGYAQLLRLDGGLNPTQSARVDAMLMAGNHLLQMITCVLDLSEIEVEHFELRPVGFDVRAVAEACLDLVRPAAEAKGLTLSIVVAPGTRRELVADPMRVRQVLLNLLGNAAKYTMQGGIEVRLREVAAPGVTDGPDVGMPGNTPGNALGSKTGGMLRIEIADTGIGVPSEQRQRLFHEFDRLDSEATGQTEGAGLGLALATRLAALMGGRLDHDDNPGGGSVFWLELPLGAEVVSGEASVPSLGGEPDGQVPVSVRVLRVLVVDDVLMNRDIASSFLRSAGHEVICAEDGVEAVALVGSTAFDVVLMDVRMPGMDGLEATRRIRALGGTRGGVPIIALTAHAFREQIEECRQAGMNSHLSKPFDMDALLAAVASAGEAGRRENKAGGQAAASWLASGGALTGPAAVAPGPSIDEGLPVCNEAAFERTAQFLQAATVAMSMRTIAELGETVLFGLCHMDDAASAEARLLEAAHTLAGSAGMFGFESLASIGRRFEQALQTDASEASAMAEEFRAAIEATLQAIETRRLVAREAESAARR